MAMNNASSLFLLLLLLLAPRTDATIARLFAPLLGVWLAPLINLFYDDAAIEKDLCYDFVWQFQAYTQLDCQCQGHLNIFLEYEGTLSCTSIKPACLTMIKTSANSPEAASRASQTCADVQISARAQTETIDILGAAFFALWGDDPRGLEIVDKISMTFQSVLRTEPPITLDGTASGAIVEIFLGVDTASIQYETHPPVTCSVSVVENVLFDFSCPAEIPSSARVNVAFSDPDPRPEKGER